MVAIQDLDLDIFGGQIHSIVGLNGAGKSTVVHLLAGVLQTDWGTVSASKESGRTLPEVSLVPQELMFVPTLSVGRNITLGHESTLTRRPLSRQEHQRVVEVLRRVGLDLDPTTDPGGCSAPQLRLIQVAKALYAPGTVMLLDEPTAVLAARDADRLMSRLETLRDQGEAIVYVSHRLSEVLRLSDVITVLKDGQKVGFFERGQVTREELLDLLTSDRPDGDRNHLSAVAPLDSTVLELKGLSAPGFDRLDLQVNAGEVVALVGLQDAGQSSAVRALAGLNPPIAGSVHLGGEQVGVSDPTAAVAAGITLVPAERRTAGVIGNMTVRENTVISPRARSQRLGLRLRNQERRVADTYRKRLRIKSGATQLVAMLSGGNQQKVAIARALETQPRVLLLDEPTQGIDAATKGEILSLLKSAARDAGAALLASTSQLDEVPGWADRVVVFRQGQVVGVLAGHEVSEPALLAMSVK
ncbi:MAG TPA: sugar ABC transporter ATP-binding protein [Acidimicrobiia bacterium]|nr:sugar ABC transporter ATP-binding protein [Acidimicrobiia bacterium]